MHVVAPVGHDEAEVEALVKSPDSRLGRVDSTLHSTVSMLRTMELIVGLPPLTQFDIAATPMLNRFRHRPNFAPYNAMVPIQPLTEVNLPTAPMAAESAAMDSTFAGATNDIALNEAIWKSVRGENTSMPAPRSVTGLGQRVTAAS